MGGNGIDKTRYEVEVHEFSQATIEMADKKLDELYALYHECSQKQEWPRRPETVHTLEYIPVDCGEEELDEDF